MFSNISTLALLVGFLHRNQKASLQSIVLENVFLETAYKRTLLPGNAYQENILKFKLVWIFRLVLFHQIICVKALRELRESAECYSTLFSSTQSIYGNFVLTEIASSLQGLRKRNLIRFSTRKCGQVIEFS